MAGNDSETDGGPPEQLPLNEEEMAVLEAYLDQWNSTSGEERNTVWGDATTEAQLKAPAMNAKLLRSRKKVYRKWRQNHGEKKDGKPPINLGRKWTYWSVVESLRKKELLKTIEDETGAKPGEQGMMNYYARYLTEMVNSLTEKEVEEATEMAAQWNKQGVPPEVQADTARCKSDEILQYVAKEIFKKAGMRLFMLSAWKTKKGKLMVSGHDYNDEVGKWESFANSSDWQTILPEWESYAGRQFDADIEDDTVVKKGRKNNAYTLDIGDNGCPILPDHATMDSDTRKAVVRAFLNWHYQDCSGKPKDPVPWKEVIPRQEELIPPPYLPEGRKIWEPSRMNRDEATELLDFWYNRQENCQDIVFEFHGWWSKSDKDIKPPVAWINSSEVDGRLKKKLREKCKAALTRGKPTTWVIVSSDNSEGEFDQARAKSTKVIKPTQKLQSRVNTEGSEDEFNALDSSEESSDGTDEPVKPMKRISGRTDAQPKRKTKAPQTEQDTSMDDGSQLVPQKKPRAQFAVMSQAHAAAPKKQDNAVPQEQSGAQPAAVSGVSELSSIVDGAETVEPSASRAPPTPVEKPRRVGPASHPGGMVRSNPKSVEQPASYKPVKESGL
ncbi:hypothetical protein DFJ58DRAFT_735769 [Suillus subalutaceus]|uniref:uncharacterized protein n=1 Tax=Suillus subalutaceus TaxID=48586 RepID=UPI001B876B40|nr:uncharacterized protein DFJ58DRAFT_735769 [Suillus subalutaceus]KAG1834636.1 hypothetical protein DFJ58DRAFT_735769 [Suillus subalutaceus]